MRVIAQPMPANPTLPMNPTLPAEPNPTLANTTVTTQMPVAKSAAMAATSTSVIVYNLAQGKFEGMPYPSGNFQEGEGPSTPSCNNPQEEQQPEAAATVTTPQNREGTPWPNTMQLPQTCSMLGHLHQLPLLKHPQLLRWRRQRRRPHPG